MRKSASAENLVEAELCDVDDGGLSLVLGILGLSRLRKQTPDLVDVDGGAELSVEVSSEDSDTLLTEMTGVELEDVRSLMSKTTSLASTSWMLSVLSNSTVTMRDVTSQLSALSFSRCLLSVRFLPF